MPDDPPPGAQHAEHTTSAHEVHAPDPCCDAYNRRDALFALASPAPASRDDVRAEALQVVQHDGQLKLVFDKDKRRLLVVLDDGSLVTCEFRDTRVQARALYAIAVLPVLELGPAPVQEPAAGSYSPRDMRGSHHRSVDEHNVLDNERDGGLPDEDHDDEPNERADDADEPNEPGLEQVVLAESAGQPYHAFGPGSVVSDSPARSQHRRVFCQPEPAVVLDVDLRTQSSIDDGADRGNGWRLARDDESTAETNGSASRPAVDGSLEQRMASQYVESVVLAGPQAARGGEIYWRSVLFVLFTTHSHIALVFSVKLFVRCFSCDLEDIFPYVVGTLLAAWVASRLVTRVCEEFSLRCG